MDVDPLALTLVRAWEVVERLEIPTAVMGGISLAAWNHPRFTQDVDLLLALPDTEKEAVVARLLEADFFFKKDEKHRCCFTHSRLSAIHGVGRNS